MMGCAGSRGEPTPPADDEILTKYTDLPALRDFLASGDVALVKASHFLRLAESGGAILLRRQDLPADAIVDRASHMWQRMAEDGYRDDITVLVLMLQR